MNIIPSTFIILTPGFPKDESDTTCTPFIQSFVKVLKRLYPTIEIIILAFDYPFTKKIYLWNGIKVFALNHRNSRGIKRYMQLYFVYRKLKQLHTTKNIKGVLSFWLSYTAFIGHYYSKLNSVQHHCWLNGQDARKNNRILRFFTPSTTELISLSASMKKEFFNNYNIEIKHTIPVGLDKQDFDDIPEAPKTIDIIGVGALIPLKQWNIFISVVASLVKHLPDLKCLLCGTGTDKKNIQQLIKHHNLEQTVILTGEISHPEALSLMKRSKILLHPSSYEGYGKVFTEALYAGCHCISFVNPEQKKIQNWHIVKNEDEMISQCREVLSYYSEAFYPVKVHDMGDCVHDVMALYGLKNTASIPSAIAP